MGEIFFGNTSVYMSVFMGDFSHSRVRLNQSPMTPYPKKLRVLFQPVAHALRIPVSWHLSQRSHIRRHKNIRIVHIDPRLINGQRLRLQPHNSERRIRLQVVAKVQRQRLNLVLLLLVSNGVRLRLDLIGAPQQRWVIAIETKIQLPNTLPIVLNCVIGIINWSN